MTPLSSLKALRPLLKGGDLLTAFVSCYGRPRAAVDGATRRTTGRDFSRSPQFSRRMTAAPSRVREVAFSFVVRTHGLIAPALRQFCGLMPCGNPSGLPCPRERSANPHGVAHP